MSIEGQPDPVLPNYNPSAWTPVFTAEEEAVLNTKYVKYPTAQDSPITFPNTIKTDTIVGTTTATAMTIGGTTDVGSITIGSVLQAGDKLLLGSSSSTATIDGILKTPSITSTANMTIASPSSSTMTIANSAETIIFMGSGTRTGVAGVGAGTVSHRYSGGNGALIGNSVTLNNGDQNKSSTFIQCGPGLDANKSNGNVEIKTGLFNTGEVRIGQYTSDTNKTTTVIKGDLRANKIDANLASPASSTVMSIGSNMLGGSVEIFTGSNQKGSINMGQWTSDAPINKTSTNIEGDVNIASVTGGNVVIGDSALTQTVTVNQPITMGYTVSLTSFSQIGYTEAVGTAFYTYVFSGGDRIYGWRDNLPAGTYMCSALTYNDIATSYNRNFWSAIKLTPTSGYDWTNIPGADKVVIDNTDVTQPVNNAYIRSQSSSPIMISGEFTTICFVTNTFQAGTPSATMAQSYSVTRIG